MPKPKWTRKVVLELAANYETLKSFREEQKGAYLYACKHNFTAELASGLKRELKPKGYWTKERCKKTAERYKTRSDFMRNEGSAYNACLRNDWLDDVCSHMKREADGYHHCVYGIFNDRLKKAYVGITRQRVHKRFAHHRSKQNTAKSKYISAFDDTKFVQLTPYSFKAHQVKQAELSWITHYERLNYEVLNDAKQVGRTGTDRRIYTDELLAAEAAKYDRRVDFKTKSPKHYDAACAQGILDKVCLHMRSINKKSHWNKETCIQFALTCKDQTDCAKANNGAYEAARTNDWLEDIQALLRTRRSMGWLKPNARKHLWLEAQTFYELWLANDQCGRDKFKSITGYNVDAILKKFKMGWIPRQDQEWVKWKSQF